MDRLPPSRRDYRELTVRIHKDVLAAAKRCAKAEDSDLNWLVEASLQELIPALDDTRTNPPIRWPELKTGAE